MIYFGYKGDFENGKNLKEQVSDTFSEEDVKTTLVEENLDVRLLFEEG